MRLVTLAIKSVGVGAQVFVLAYVPVAQVNVQHLVGVALAAQVSAAEVALIIAAAVVVVVVMAVALAVLVPVRVAAKVPVQDVPLHALPIVVTLAQMIVLVIVAQLAA